MECSICNVEKLANEFCLQNVSELCKHPALFCMRCTIQKVKETSTCPHPGCDIPVTLSDQRLQLFQARLDRMFKVYDTTYTPEEAAPSMTGGTLTITLLTGESMQIFYNSNMLVQEVKRQIRLELKHDVDKQKLLYNETEIKDYLSDGRQARLSDFGVKPNSSLCLVILLFSIPDNFDHVIFDLHWGYPSTGCDFLDASCLIFNGKINLGKCDFSSTSYGSAIRHSGDVMDNVRSIGHHTIDVKLKQIPINITHLFFTLSAWTSPNISKYPNPSLKFYEAAKPGTDLCKTTFSHAGHSQAVIMCSLSRGSDGRWKIFESGKGSAGNASDYSPIVYTIQSLIAQGC